MRHCKLPGDSIFPWEQVLLLLLHTSKREVRGAYQLRRVWREGVDTMNACLFVVAFESSSRRVERSLVKALSTSHRCVGICV